MLGGTGDTVICFNLRYLSTIISPSQGHQTDSTRDLTASPPPPPALSRKEDSIPLPGNIYVLQREFATITILLPSFNSNHHQTVNFQGELRYFAAYLLRQSAGESPRLRLDAKDLISNIPTHRPHSERNWEFCLTSCLTGVIHAGVRTTQKASIWQGRVTVTFRLLC